jgi:hypothetical protein
VPIWCFLGAGGVDEEQEYEEMRTGITIFMVYLSALLLAGFLLSGCADVQTADEACSARFGPSGNDYWNCMYFTQRQTEHTDALWSQMHGMQAPNPLQYMPPTVYTQGR